MSTSGTLRLHIGLAIPAILVAALVGGCGEPAGPDLGDGAGGTAAAMAPHEERGRATGGATGMPTEIDFPNRPPVPEAIRGPSPPIDD